MNNNSPSNPIGRVCWALQEVMIASTFAVVEQMAGEAPSTDLARALQLLNPDDLGTLDRSIQSFAADLAEVIERLIAGLDSYPDRNNEAISEVLGDLGTGNLRGESEFLALASKSVECAGVVEIILLEPQAPSK